MTVLLCYYEQQPLEEGKVTMPTLVRKELLVQHSAKQIKDYIATKKDRTGAPYIRDDESHYTYVAAVAHITVVQKMRDVPVVVYPKNKVSDVSLGSQVNVESQKNLIQSESGVPAATGTSVSFQQLNQEPFARLSHLMMHTLASALKPQENLLKDYYTYIPFTRMGELIHLTRTLGVKSFIDLGSGAPVIPAALNIALGIQTGAVEVRQEIYDACSFSFQGYTDFYCTDMFNCTEEFLNRWEAIYMYVPIMNSDLMLKFIQHLHNNTRVGQFLILAGFGQSSINYLESQQDFQKVRIFDTYSLLVYKRIK